jgi:hypothetical protein
MTAFLGSMMVAILDLAAILKCAIMKLLCSRNFVLIRFTDFKQYMTVICSLSCVNFHVNSAVSTLFFIRLLRKKYKCDTDQIIMKSCGILLAIGISKKKLEFILV